MNFNMIGNMNTYLRTTELKSMWNMRKKNNDYSSKGQERLDQMFERIYGKNAEKENGSDSRLSDIRNKLNAGQSLTPDEMEYLRQKDPQTYNDLQQEEQEQKAFEKKLRQCKTKEDVQRLKMGRINQSLSAIGAVEHNAAIPKGEKLGIILREGRRMKRVEESVAKFVKSGEFAKLPTDAEERLARKEEAAQKQPEQTSQEEPATAKKNESADKVEKTEESKEGSTAEDATAPEISTAENYAQTTEQQKPAQTTTEFSRPLRQEIHADSPELRKVRRARAKAAYTANSPEFTPKTTVSVPSLERKA